MAELHQDTVTHAVVRIFDFFHWEVFVLTIKKCGRVSSISANVELRWFREIMLCGDEILCRISTRTNSTACSRHKYTTCRNSSTISCEVV
jgi:hypothetical protein